MQLVRNAAETARPRPSDAAASTRNEGFCGLTKQNRCIAQDPDAYRDQHERQEDVSVATNRLTNQGVVHQLVPGATPEARHHGEREDVYRNRMNATGENRDVHRQVIPTIGNRHAGNGEHLRMNPPLEQLFLVTRPNGVRRFIRAKP